MTGKREKKEKERPGRLQTTIICSMEKKKKKQTIGTTIKEPN